MRFDVIFLRCFRFFLGEGGSKRYKGEGGEEQWLAGWQHVAP
jgi:hypothetical protein